MVESRSWGIYSPFCLCLGKPKEALRMTVTGAWRRKPQACMGMVKAKRYGRAEHPQCLLPRLVYGLTFYNKQRLLSLSHHSLFFNFSLVGTLGGATSPGVGVLKVLEIAAYQRPRGSARSAQPNLKELPGCWILQRKAVFGKTLPRTLICTAATENTERKG